MPAWTQRSTSFSTPFTCDEAPWTPATPGNAWRSTRDSPQTDEDDPWGGLLDDPVFDLVDPTTRALTDLFASPRLTSDQIVQARRLISELPAEEQGPWFLQLQGKTSYDNQRDNLRGEYADGGTCNLTAVAMALRVLGLESSGGLDFDDDLVDEALDRHMALGATDTWSRLAGELGATTESADKGTRTRAWWEAQVRDRWLAQGFGVVASIWGHVVRIQGVTDAGVVVDDPYGRSVLRKSSEADNNNYSFAAVNGGFPGERARSETAGEDNVWPWRDVLAYNFKYFRAYQAPR